MTSSLTEQVNNFDWGLAEKYLRVQYFSRCVEDMDTFLLFCFCFLYSLSGVVTLTDSPFSLSI